MIKYRGTQMIRAGFIGTVLIVLVIGAGLSPDRLTSWATTVRYGAVFTEAGGIRVGDDVKISGVKIGTVSGVSLRHGDALVTFSVAGSVPLGSQTTAHIRTGTLLGQRILTLESAGDRTMRPLDVIPVTRTGVPYSLTEAVGDLTTNIAGTDTGSLNAALDTLSATLDQISPQLGPALDGLSRLSRSLNNRNETVGELLAHAADVTGILAERSMQVNTLLLDGNDLLGVLVERREVIVKLLNDTSALAKQLSGVIADNQAELAPALRQLNAVTSVLEKNRDNIAKALPGLAKFENTVGETVANGPFYTAYVPNVDLPAIVQPFFDYAFGFRRGTDAGQPPDNSGPRAEIPFPYNGIPQPNEQWGH